MSRLTSMALSSSCEILERSLFARPDALVLFPVLFPAVLPVPALLLAVAVPFFPLDEAIFVC